MDYIIKITVRRKDFFLLWDSEHEPVFLTDENGRAVFFGSLVELNAFAEINRVLSA